CTAARGGAARSCANAAGSLSGWSWRRRFDMSGALKSVGSAIGGLGQQLFGGSRSRASQQSGIDPRFFDMFASNLERAKGVAEALGPRQFADFTPDFWAGAQTLRDTVSGPAMGTTNNAVAMAQQA